MPVRSNTGPTGPWIQPWPCCWLGIHLMASPPLLREIKVNRVSELKELVQDMKNLSTHRIVLTTEFIIEQLIGVVIDARSQERPDSAGANKALHLLGLELGMFVEREERGKPGEFDGLTIAGKRERILSIASQLGLRHVSQVLEPIDAE